MAHFRGTVQGNRSDSSRLGSVKSGMVVQAQSWEGKCVAVAYWNAEKGKNYVRVTLEQHHGHGAWPARELYNGPIDGSEVSNA